MPPSPCHHCKTQSAKIRRPKDGSKLCVSCFTTAFETEIHHTITASSLFQRGERIAIGASGGKDSTVLASVLKTLNERHDYGLDLVLLSIDEGIRGYRDDSLETVKRNAVQYGMPLTILGYDELYGWTMDQVVEQVGKKGNCTYCGVFRRQALDRGAARLGVRHVVTGHNADDIAETVLMNLLRGDLPRLARTTSIVTSTPSAVASTDPNSRPHIKRSKPLKYAYEKEIVLYAHHKKLDYFSTECIYSPEAFRGTARSLIKSLERTRPSAILDIVRSGEDMAKLVPGNEEGCGGVCQGSVAVAEEEEGGCGSSKPGATGGYMEKMEEQLTLDREAVEKELEVEITSSSCASPGMNGAVPLPKSDKKTNNNTNNNHKKASKGQLLPSRRTGKQVVGFCKRPGCGAMTSQEICQACQLVEQLNKNRPKHAVEVVYEGEEKRDDGMLLHVTNGIAKSVLVD
ncbi:adenine nucleotide alpha hydrolases-like protein [Westerdykella ornata]|uniref:Cytoplasmic tRNA 2-thiolation protein 1 n=1 Tax=Westerdykella ornata TaxID=318751 RepID=A0A6A6JKG4_WESOR|nr:adenine nucleotide alpha hydrolases-like protein [Westerdykella ornata]KAF2277140.1 adenine nucleotide alpha hydrolases-like protein [Westerdykella ornata]